jgi:hypothetical protein
MCELFGVKDVNTITRWRRDPRIKALPSLQGELAKVRRTLASLKEKK